MQGKEKEDDKKVEEKWKMETWGAGMMREEGSVDTGKGGRLCQKGAVTEAKWGKKNVRLAVTLKNISPYLDYYSS